MYNCTVEHCNLLSIYYAVSILSVVMCMVTIAVMIYYKFYRSFNYRLILYLLVSFLVKVLIFMIAYALAFLLDTAPHFDTILVTLKSIFWYPVWNIQLCIAFMTAEIFSMVIFSVELRKAEIPLTIACFTLPLVELVGLCFHEPMDHFFRYNAILGMVITSICAIATAITLICLAYHALRKRAISNDNEQQHLLHTEHTRQRYRNALKESLPFIIYPAMIMIWFLMYYILVYIRIQPTNKLSDAWLVFDGNIGTISSIVFFVHIKILGRHRRNVFRNRAHSTATRHSIQETNEEQIITIAGSITATHVTHFDPLGDSDVEP